MRWILIAGVLAISCQHDDTPHTMPPPPETHPAAAPGPTVVITTPNGDVPVAVEVVATEASIERGLMFRTHLPPNDGMLFLLHEEKDWPFWMHNTLIPLDLIYIRRNMTIAGIVQNAEPQTDTLRRVGEPSVFVLEVNGGFTASHGIAANQTVRFDNVQR